MSYAKRITTILTVPVLAIALAFFADSCGKSGGGSSSSDNASTSNGKYGPLIQIPMYTAGNTQPSAGLDLLSDPGLAGLNLTGSAPGGETPTSAVYNLSGCASGLAGNTASSSVVNVYLHDTTCVVKLTSFVLGGITYTAGTYTGTTAGSTSVFTSTGASPTITIISQLSSPINTSDFVSFQFSFDVAGTNSATFTVGTAQSLFAAGQDAPIFKINASNISFNSINGSGLGSLTFTITCATGTSGTNGIMTAATFTFCPTVAGGVTPNGVDINSALSPQQFAYKLVTDTAANEIGGNTVGTITLAAAITAMSGVTNGIPAGVVGSVGTNGLIVNSAANTGFLVTLNTPQSMSTAANAKMILILEALNTAAGFTANSTYASFQYFPITYTAVTP